MSDDGWDNPILKTSENSGKGFRDDKSYEGFGGGNGFNGFGATKDGFSSSTGTDRGSGFGRSGRFDNNRGGNNYGRDDCSRGNDRFGGGGFGATKDGFGSSTGTNRGSGFGRSGGFDNNRGESNNGRDDCSRGNDRFGGGGDFETTRDDFGGTTGTDRGSGFGRSGRFDYNKGGSNNGRDDCSRGNDRFGRGGFGANKDGFGSSTGTYRGSGFDRSGRFDNNRGESNNGRDDCSRGNDRFGGGDCGATKDGFSTTAGMNTIPGFGKRVGLTTTGEHDRERGFEKSHGEFGRSNRSDGMDSTSGFGKRVGLSNRGEREYDSTKDDRFIGEGSRDEKSFETFGGNRGFRDSGSTFNKSGGFGTLSGGFCDKNQGDASFGSGGFGNSDFGDEGFADKGFASGATRETEFGFAENRGFSQSAKGFRNNGAFGKDDPERKPASTFMPIDEDITSLFNEKIDQGALFNKFFDATVTLTKGGLHGNREEIQKMNSFDDVYLTERIRQNVTQAGYSRPTPIQQFAMPVINSGRDVMACAQTGSGKTAAFLLPIMSKLMETEDLSNSGERPCSPRCIIIAPTRELAVQIYNEGRKFAHNTVMYIACIYGGTSVALQAQSLTRGATILVATTGRLKHFLEEDIISFSKVKYVVLDEADRMLDLGFGDDINYVMNYPSMTPKEQRQTLMFSATFPTEVQITATDLLRSDFLMITIDEIGAANKCITQEIIQCERSEKRDKLLNLLNVDLETYTTDRDAEVFKKKTIVFVSRKTFADTLGAILCEANIPCTTIHGDRLQNQRAQAIKDFKIGRKPVLIATAVAERGLDIKGVDHVINYDLPSERTDYIHRIGRTGRVGNAGRATSFYVSETDSALAPHLVEILSQAEQVVPSFLLAEVGCVEQGFHGSGAANFSSQVEENW